jgi:hypothetical protein
MNSKIIILTVVSLLGFTFSFAITRDWFDGGDIIERGINALLFFLVLQTLVAASSIWLLVLLVKYWSDITTTYKIFAIAGALPVVFYLVFILLPILKLFLKP